MDDARNIVFKVLYKEDETPERLETIKRTNDLLKQLKGQ
jgi:hypothetical protein